MPSEHGYTRTQAAAILGCDRSTVRRMEGTVLHPKIVRRVRYFEPAAIYAEAIRRGVELPPHALAQNDDDLPARSLSHEQAHAVMSELINGLTVAEVALKLRLNPYHVRAVHRDFRDDIRKKHRALVDAMKKEFDEKLEAEAKADREREDHGKPPKKTGT